MDYSTQDTCSKILQVGNFSMKKAIFALLVFVALFIYGTILILIYKEVKLNSNVRDDILFLTVIGSLNLFVISILYNHLCQNDADKF